MAAVEALMQTSLEAFDAGDLELARAGFEAVLEHAPDHSEAWYQSGLVDFQAGRTEAALRKLERSLVLRPLPENILEVARIYHGMGELARAQELLSQAEIQTPNSPALHYLKGVVMGDLRQLDQALWHLDQALQCQYEPAATLQQIGQIHERLGERSMAIRCYRASLSFNPHQNVSVERLCHHGLLQRTTIEQGLANRAVELGSVFATCPSHSERGAKLLVASHLSWAESISDR